MNFKYGAEYYGHRSVWFFRDTVFQAVIQRECSLSHRQPCSNGKAFFISVPRCSHKRFLRFRATKVVYFLYFAKNRDI